jgi:hypothetical protein
MSYVIKLILISKFPIVEWYFIHKMKWHLEIQNRMQKFQILAPSDEA